MTRKATPARAPLAPPSIHAFFVSVHIPKTAGTTLATVFERAFRRRVLFDYPADADYRQPDPLLAENAAFVASWFRGIHGHFAVERHLPVFGGARYIACLRHPVDRILSQYEHEYNDPAPHSLWHSRIRQGMDVVEFAMQEGIRDAFVTHLSALEIDDYDLLLISENLAGSLSVLNFVIGNMKLPVYFGDPPVLPAVNTAAQRPQRIAFSEAERAEVFRRIPEDVAIYRRAVELLERKAGLYL